MSEHSNNRGFGERLKNAKINRTTAITAAILVTVLVVIIALTIAANRSKKNELPDDTDHKVSDTQSEQPPADTSADTQTPADTQPSQKPADTSASATEEPLPSFVLPVSGALSKKHDPELQVYSNTMNDYRVHLGVDLVTEENAPVYAAADGTVSKIWKDVLMGYCIAVSHGGDSMTVYKNLGEDLPDGIEEGVKVRSGQLIATVGESAMIEVADEPHLHFELVIEDLAVDPLEYFSEKALESLSKDGSHGE